ncbi:hypothetical protein EDB84DRAFT_24245 [Lactarius hengduanensis]|nr:hypothetical protein EDB84DRAFT_24245 [Lactarius hengduanensis]
MTSTLTLSGISDREFHTARTAQSYHRSMRMHIWLSYPRSSCCVLPLRSEVCRYYTCRLLVFFFRLALVSNTDTSREREERSIQRRCAARRNRQCDASTHAAQLPRRRVVRPPSDSEDSFFLMPDETADLHRTKRMRHLDALHTAHMRALSPAPCLDDDDDDTWGGSDEESEHQPIVGKKTD